MPTTETAEAFVKLVAARTRLTEITKQLNEAHAELSSGGVEARIRHDQFQAEWEEAFRDFEVATDEFSATVKNLHAEVEARKSSPE